MVNTSRTACGRFGRALRSKTLCPGPDPGRARSQRHVPGIDCASRSWWATIAFRSSPASKQTRSWERDRSPTPPGSSTSPGPRGSLRWKWTKREPSFTPAPRKAASSNGRSKMGIRGWSARIRRSPPRFPISDAFSEETRSSSAAPMEAYRCGSTRAARRISGASSRRTSSRGMPPRSSEARRPRAIDSS